MLRLPGVFVFIVATSFAQSGRLPLKNLRSDLLTRWRTLPATILPAGDQDQHTCSVPLLQAPTPKDVHFTMTMLRPRQTPRTTIVKPPAPACPARQNRVLR